jgi:hypothetical protein
LTERQCPASSAWMVEILDQAPLPDDSDAVAAPFDFGQVVRGKKDGPARRTNLGQERKEFALH